MTNLMVMLNLNVKKFIVFLDEDNIIILLNDNILNISYIQSKNILIKIKKIILKKFK